MNNYIIWILIASYQVNKKYIVKDLKNLDDLLEFNNLSEIYELFSNENQKVIGKFKKETLIVFWDEYIC